MVAALLPWLNKRSTSKPSATTSVVQSSFRVLATNSIISMLLAIGAWASLRLFAWPLYVNGLFGLSIVILAAGFVTWNTLRVSPVIVDTIRRGRQTARLESLTHPLLLRLSQEAPGTFHHSLQVGALASHVADAIHADAQLARLGGYYHDVGKLPNPQNFIENQADQPNPLDRLSPRRAAQAIIAHVDDGLQLARAYRLPAAIIAFIPQHVGTTRVQYFLAQASASGKRYAAEDFQYPGPKPQTREAMIVMLADAIEAKIRLVHNPSRNVLAQLVEETIHEKRADHQFEFLQFTDRNYQALSQAFVAALEPMHHKRIAYPHRTPSQKENHR